MHHAKRLVTLPTNTELPLETVRFGVHRFLQIRGYLAAVFITSTSKRSRFHRVNEIQHSDRQSETSVSNTELLFTILKVGVHSSLTVSLCTQESTHVFILELR